METTGNLTLNNCTFTDNTATFNGGVAYNKEKATQYFQAAWQRGVVDAKIHLNLINNDI